MPRLRPGLFYPSCVVNFTFRFDESMLGRPLAPVSTDDLVESGAAVALADDNLTQVIGCTPKSATVELPGYRQAGTFNITLQYQHFPIDPRVIRALGVEVHMGAVSARAFAKGMTEAPPAGQRRSSIINTKTQDGSVNLETLLIDGVADGISVEHTEKDSLVHIEGRDKRGLLLDSPFGKEAAAKISTSMNRPINLVVEHILKFHPILKSMLNTEVGPRVQGPCVQVIVDPEEWDNGVPVVANLPDLNRFNQKAAGGEQKMASKGDPDGFSFWDVITQFCFLVGAVPYFMGNQLRIRPARSLYKQLTAGEPGNPAPFANGEPRSVTIQNGSQKNVEELTIRRLVYGHDIDSFKMERKLAGTSKRPTVVCVGPNVESDSRENRLTRLEARWPETPSASTVSPDGAAQETLMWIPVPGIKNMDRLKQLARNIYEEMGRSEIGGSVSTKNLASFGGSNQDPDLLHLRPGNAIEILSAANAVLQNVPPIMSELNYHSSTSMEAEIAAVTKRLGNRTIAEVLVRSMRGGVAEQQRRFRVHTVRFDWKAESGVSLDFDFQNYVEARESGTATSTTTPTPAAATGTAQA